MDGDKFQNVRRWHKAIYQTGLRVNKARLEVTIRYLSVVRVSDNCWTPPSFFFFLAQQNGRQITSSSILSPKPMETLVDLRQFCHVSRFRATPVYKQSGYFDRLEQVIAFLKFLFTFCFLLRYTATCLPYIVGRHIVTSWTLPLSLSFVAFWTTPGYKCFCGS